MPLHVWTAINLNRVVPEIEFHDLINIVSTSVGNYDGDHYDFHDFHHTVSVCTSTHSICLVTYVEAINEYLQSINSSAPTPLEYLSHDLIKLSGPRFTVYIHTKENNPNFNHYQFLLSVSTGYIDSSDTILFTDYNRLFCLYYLNKLPPQLVNKIFLNSIPGYIVQFHVVKTYFGNLFPKFKLTYLPSQPTSKNGVDLANIDVELMFGANISPKKYDPLNSLVSNMNSMKF